MAVTTYRERLKRWLGAPCMDVELDEKADLADKNTQDDFDLIEERVLRIISTFFPCEYIMSKSIPAAGSVRGNGYIDLSDEDIITLKEVYCIKPKVDSGDVLLPWSMVRIWEKIWVGASEFVSSFAQLLHLGCNPGFLFLGRLKLYSVNGFSIPHFLQTLVSISVFNIIDTILALFYGFTFNYLINKIIKFFLFYLTSDKLCEFICKVLKLSSSGTLLYDFGRLFSY